MFVLVTLAILLLASPCARGQSYTVLHQFTGGPDGGAPYAGLTMDAAGNFYGTTCGSVCGSSANSLGTVFRLSQHGTSWVLTNLHTFHGGDDGAGPTGRVIFGPDGALYGTTFAGGGTGCGGAGCGTVFRLTPPPSVAPSAMNNWRANVIYRFQGAPDAWGPELGDVAFDSAGNLYGTTTYGGSSDLGTVFQLTPAGSGWTESVLHSFTFDDGAYPSATLSVSSLQNSTRLIGTASIGGQGVCFGAGCGTVFQLSSSQSGWIENIVYYFTGGDDGGNPMSGSDGVFASGSWGGRNGGGTALLIASHGLFQFGFTGSTNYFSGPWNSFVATNGLIYGTTYADGAHGQGSVAYLYGCAGWSGGSVYDFTGQQDGANPISNLVPVGTSPVVLYGTTSAGGAHGAGVIFALTLPPPPGPSDCSVD
jgi:uncharacterized repeat protein (TIGR03803 family)